MPRLCGQRGAGAGDGAAGQQLGAEPGAASSEQPKATLSVVSLQRNKSVPGFIRKEALNGNIWRGTRCEQGLLVDDAPGLAALSCNRYLSIRGGFARAAEITQGLVCLMEINTILVSWKRIVENLIPVFANPEGEDVAGASLSASGKGRAQSSKGHWSSPSSPGTRSRAAGWATAAAGAGSGPAGPLGWSF